MTSVSASESPSLSKTDKPLDQLLDEVIGQRFLSLIVARNLLENFGFPAPILQHLRGSLDEIPRHAVNKHSTISTRFRIMNGTDETGRHTNLVPWNLENCVLLNNPCTACPNSWKKVTASANGRNGRKINAEIIMKVGFHTVMRHQRRTFRSRFSQIGDHGYRRIVPVPVSFEVSRNQTPNSGVRVLRSCVAIVSEW